MLHQVTEIVKYVMMAAGSKLYNKQSPSDLGKGVRTFELLSFDFMLSSLR